MPTIHVYPNPTALTAALVDIWASWRAGEGIFLSGGGTFQELYQNAPYTPATLFLADERLVAEDQPESTTRQIRELYQSRFPGADFRTPTVDDPNPAGDYEATLDFWAETGTFTTALLGVGSDGHTASLFPKAFASVSATEDKVALVQAELDPFVPRLTLTPSFLRSLPQCYLVAYGEGKKDILRRILVENEDLPATRIGEGAVFLLDEAAAQDIPEALRQAV